MGLPDSSRLITAHLLSSHTFSVPKCVRTARISEKSYELLCKMFSAVPERTKEELESILGKKFMGYVSGNFSDFERQKQRGSTVTDYNAVGVRRFSNKELGLTKESMGALPKSSEYCGPIRKKSYSYVSGVIGIAYNPFLSEDIREINSLITSKQCC